MIKVFNTTQIEYTEDVLPYIRIEGLAVGTIALLEIHHANGKRTHYFIENDYNVNPQTMFDIAPPMASLIFFNNGSTIIRTNTVVITDWNKFMNKNMLSPEMKIAQLENRIRDLEMKSPTAKPENLMVPVGSVLTMCEGGKQHFKLPYTFSVQVINGKKPNKDGVIEIKLTDMPDLVLVLQGLLDSLNAMNLRIAQVETQVQDLIDPVL